MKGLVSYDEIHKRFNDWWDEARFAEYYPDIATKVIAEQAWGLAWDFATAGFICSNPVSESIGGNMAKKGKAGFDEILKHFDDWFAIFQRENPYLPRPIRWAVHDALRSAFIDAWRRAENYLPEEAVSESVERRIHEIFSEAIKLSNDLSDKLSQSEEILIER